MNAMDLREWKDENVYRSGIESAKQTLGESVHEREDSAIFSVFGEAMERLDGNHAGMQSAVDALSGCGSETSICTAARVNTFPFGVPTNAVYNEFIGFCGSGTTLTKAFTAMCSYCKNVQRLHDDKVREAVLFTNRWDAKVFEKYEQLLINYSAQNSVRILFFLVTDFGMTRIPFFDFANRPQYSIPYMENHMEEALLDNPIIYRLVPGTWQMDRPCEEYRIDLCAHRIAYDIPPERGVKSISGASARHFIKEVSFLYKNGALTGQDNFALDAGGHELSIFGLHFSWGAGNREFEKVETAIEELLKRGQSL